MKKIYIFVVINLFLITGNKAQNWVQDCVQLMHNSADASLATLKIWVNDTVWVNNLMFQQSTARKTFVAGTYTMGVSLPTATAQSQSIIQQTFDIGSGIDNQFLIINGIVNDPTHPLSVNSYTEGLYGQPSPFQGYLNFYNGCTTFSILNIAFTPSLSLTGQQQLNISNLAYAQKGSSDVDISVSNPNFTYTLAVNSGTANLGIFSLPSSLFLGKVLRIAMNSSYNLAQKGAGLGFGLVIVPANGGSVTPLTKIVIPTDVNGVETEHTQIKIFPNPVEDVLNIALEGNTEGSFSLLMTDVAGKKVSELNNLQKFENVINVESLDEGIYFLTISKGHTTKTFKFIKN